jgi:hypothetical protein
VIKRLFLAAPVGLTLFYVVGCVVTRGDEMFVYTCVAVAKVLGGAGLMAAAVRYGRAEYLFWAWAALAVNLLLLGVAELLFTQRFDFARVASPGRETAWSMVTIVANVFAAVGTLMLARVWRAVGLALPDPSGAKRIVALVGMVVAALLVGYVEIPAWRAMMAGRLDGVVGVVGALADLVCFSVITPLVLRALSLRGGTLAWPWGMIAGCFLAWMVYDVIVELRLPVSAGVSRSIVDGMRVLACLLGMGAGLAQRWATRASAARD